jgi:hypothetical protein
VAQEHTATAVTDAALAALAAVVPGRPRGEPVLVACPEGEWHSLPGAMVTQLLRWRGIAVESIGTLPAAAALDDRLAAHRPRALALSCSTSASLPGAASAVAVAARHRVPVIAGGAGFGPQGRYAPSVGIFTWAAGAREVIRRLAIWTRHPPVTPLPPPEPLACRRLVRMRYQIVDDIVDGLVTGSETGEVLDVVRDASAQIVALTVAAARTGQPAILADGLAVIAATLAHRPDPLPAIGRRLPEHGLAVLDRLGCDIAGTAPPRPVDRRPTAGMSRPPDPGG